MSLKEYVEQWQEGSKLGEEGRYQEAIDMFFSMQEPGARIFFNAASMYLRLGNLDEAGKVGVVRLDVSTWSVAAVSCSIYGGM